MIHTITDNADGSKTCKLSLSNNSSSTKNLMLAFANYDALQNSLNSIKVEKAVITNYNIAEQSITLLMPADMTNINTKVFIWEDGTLIPIDLPIEIQ